MRERTAVVIFAILVLTASFGPAIFMEWTRPSGNQWVTDEEKIRTETIDFLIDNNTVVEFRLPYSYQVGLLIESDRPINVFSYDLGIDQRAIVFFVLSAYDSQFANALVLVSFDGNEYETAAVNITVTTVDYVGHFERYFDWEVVLYNAKIPLIYSCLGAGFVLLAILVTQPQEEV